MFRVNMSVTASFTSDVGFKHVSCMVVLLFHGTRISVLLFSRRMELEICTFILWFSVNFQVRRRRAMQRLTRRRHMFLLFHKDLRGSASSHYLGTRLFSVSIRHFERV